MRSSLADLRHGLHIARTRGTRDLAARGIKRLYGLVQEPGLEVALRLEDVSRPLVPEILNPVHEGEVPRVGFVMTPPGPTSGGHKTLSRVVEALADAGMRCRVLLYDFYGDDVGRHMPVVEQFFPRAEISNARDFAPGDLHAVFATCWESAQFIARSAIVGRRLYLIQDFEPWFHAKGTASELADQTYSLGFHGIAIGSWLPPLLKDRYGMECDSFPFACDVSEYSLLGLERGGVAFYARPATARRAFGLGMLALGLVHQARPDLEIHLFGERTGWSHFPVIDHGPVPPSELNLIYNRCDAGLALSMTNLSLVPWEMLAAGCTPVVNFMEGAMDNLDNPHVRYAPPSPEELSAAILGVIDDAPESDRSLLRSSVHSLSWADSLARVTEVVRRQLGQPREP